MWHYSVLPGCLLIGALLIWVMCAVGQPPAISADTQPAGEMTASLNFGPGQHAPGVAVPCYIHLRNATADSRTVSRPVPDKISIKATVSDGNPVKAVFTPVALGPLEQSAFVLRPNCEISMLIGTIRLVDQEKDNSAKPGTFIVKVTWRDTTALSAVPKDVEVSGNIEIVEYPLSVSLAAPSAVCVFGQAVPVSITLRNAGDKTIRLVNLFHPYKDYFDVVRSQPAKRPGESTDTPHIKTLVTPDAGEMWVTLKPSESVTVRADIRDQITTPGKHRIRVIYGRKILVQTDKPFYTNQHKWQSNEVILLVSKGA